MCTRVCGYSCDCWVQLITLIKGIWSQASDVVCSFDSHQLPGRVRSGNAREELDVWLLYSDEAFKAYVPSCWLGTLVVVLRLSGLSPVHSALPLFRCRAMFLVKRYPLLVCHGQHTRF